MVTNKHAIVLAANEEVKKKLFTEALKGLICRMVKDVVTCKQSVNITVVAGKEWREEQVEEYLFPKASSKLPFSLSSHFTSTYDQFVIRGESELRNPNIEGRVTIITLGSNNLSNALLQGVKSDILVLSDIGTGNFMDATAIETLTKCCLPHNEAAERDVLVFTTQEPTPVPGSDDCYSVEGMRYCAASCDVLRSGAELAVWVNGEPGQWLPVQINGQPFDFRFYKAFVADYSKKRTFTRSVDALLMGRTVRKVVCVPNKLVNIVAN